MCYRCLNLSKDYSTELVEKKIYQHWLKKFYRVIVSVKEMDKNEKESI